MRAVLTMSVASTLSLSPRGAMVEKARESSRWLDIGGLFFNRSEVRRFQLLQLLFRSTDSLFSLTRYDSRHWQVVNLDGRCTVR